MTLLEPTIREIRHNDDLNQIRNLLLTNRRPQLYFPKTLDGIRNWFFNQTEMKEMRRGYIATRDSNIVAFMGLDLRGKNGVIV